MTENEISKIVVDASLKVHKTLGPGLLERAYEACLAYELNKRGLNAQRQVAQPVDYDNQRMEDVGYRMDILVNDKVVVEIKSTAGLTDLDLAQTLTYLKLSECKLGLLINFNVPLIMNGIRRVVNNL